MSASEQFLSTYEDTHGKQPSLAALRRLTPYVRPVRGRLLGSGAAALGSTLAGLGIPLVIQHMIDGPIIAHRSRDAGHRRVCDSGRNTAWAQTVVGAVTILTYLRWPLNSLGWLLADVTGGRVLIDGVDVRDLALADLRTVVATTFEDPVLFSASVRENVTLGTPKATDDGVRRALRIVHAEEFVDALPWRLDTRIGEQGLTALVVSDTSRRPT